MEQAALAHRERREWRWFYLITGGAVVAAGLVVFAGDGSRVLLKFALTASDPAEGQAVLNQMTSWSRAYALGAFGLAVTLGLVVLRLRGAEHWGGRGNRPAVITAMLLAIVAAGIAAFLEWKLQATLDGVRRFGGILSRRVPSTSPLHVIQCIAAAASVAVLAWTASMPRPPRRAPAARLMNVALAMIGVCGLCFLAAGNVTGQLEALWHDKGGQPQVADLLETIRSYSILDIAAWLLWLASFAAVLIAGLSRGGAPSPTSAPTHAAPPLVASTPEPHHTASPPR